MCQGLVSRGMSGLPALAPPRPPLSLPPRSQQAHLPLAPSRWLLSLSSCSLFCRCPSCLVCLVTPVDGQLSDHMWDVLGGDSLRDATSDSVRTKMKGNPLNRALARDIEARQHDTANNSACRFDPSILEANSTPSVGKMSSTGTAKTSARRE